jgi:hypothetical protein
VNKADARVRANTGRKRRQGDAVEGDRNRQPDDGEEASVAELVHIADQHSLFRHLLGAVAARVALLIRAGLG